jgi:hypothetical protein
MGAISNPTPLSWVNGYAKRQLAQGSQGGDRVLAFSGEAVLKILLSHQLKGVGQTDFYARGAVRDARAEITLEGDAPRGAIREDLAGLNYLNSLKRTSEETVLAADTLVGVHGHHVTSEGDGPGGAGGLAGRGLAMSAMDRGADLGRHNHEKPGVKVIPIGINFEDPLPFVGHHAADQTGPTADAAARVGFDEVIHWLTAFWSIPIFSLIAR